MTRQQLADIAHVNVNSVTKYERAGEKHGQYPPLPVLAKLAKVLNLSPTEIFAEAAETDDIRSHFQRNRSLEAVSEIISVFSWIENISTDIDTYLAEAKLNLLEKLPASPDRKSFEQALFAAFPETSGVNEFRRQDMLEFYFGDTIELSPTNDPAHKEPGRSENTTSEPEAVGAASTDQHGDDDR